jgi:hypothetical protein
MERLHLAHLQSRRLVSHRTLPSPRMLQKMRQKKLLRKKQQKKQNKHRQANKMLLHKNV